MFSYNLIYLTAPSCYAISAISAMFSPNQSNSKLVDNAATNSEKTQRTSSPATSSSPSTVKTAARKPTYKSNSNSAGEINYPDPLPGGFQPGKKCCAYFINRVHFLSTTS